jgi:hypothetical protein
MLKYLIIYNKHLIPVFAKWTDVDQREHMNHLAPLISELLHKHKGTRYELVLVQHVVNI